MKLKLTATTADVRFLSFENFHGNFTKSIVAAPVLNEALAWEDFFDEKHRTEAALRDALSRQWTEHDDFEVGWDENFAFTLCGGVYTPRMICVDYLDVLHRVLRTTRHSERWAYSTAVELREPLDGMVNCDFVMQSNCITVALWELNQFDFVRYFSRSFEEARSSIP